MSYRDPLPISSFVPIGSAWIDHIEQHIPFVFILKVESLDGEAENVNRGATLQVFGIRLAVREILIRDKSTNVYRFRVRLNEIGGIFSADELRARAILLRAYEMKEVDEEAEGDPVPF